jgi:hypothetical protein
VLEGGCKDSQLQRVFRTSAEDSAQSRNEGSPVDDGHTGLKSVQVARRDTPNFALVLVQRERAGQGVDFIIHATPVGEADRRDKFLDWLGFTIFQAQCQFNNDDRQWCLWRNIALVRPDTYVGLERFYRMRHAFNEFANRIDELYDLRERFEEILSALTVTAGPVPFFRPTPVDISADPDAIPAWADELKPTELKKLESEKFDLERSIDRERTFLLLVSGTGTPLENAVLVSLRFLDLKAEMTSKGANIDIEAYNPDKPQRFGIEVTGLNDAVKKKNIKLTQLVQFEQTKDDPNQKGMLVANTFCQTPVSERSENFTSDVVRFLKPHPVLLMTGFDLYRLIQQVKAGEKKAEDVVAMLYETSGVYEHS